MKGKPLEDAYMAYRASQGGPSEHSATTALLEQLRRMANAIVWRVLKQHRDDIEWDIATHIYLNLAKFNSESSFWTWAWRVGTNEILLHLRREKQKYGTFVPENLDALESVEGQFFGSHNVAVKAALAELSKDERDLILQWSQGATTRELGDILQVDASTAHRKVQAILLRLRRLVNGRTIKSV